MEHSLHKGTKEINFENAKRMRKDPTHEEYVMWEELRNRKILNYKFRRQHPINNYIADFYCHELKLVIEIDGKYHEQEGIKQKDQKRTENLQALGITIYRITNQELSNLSLTIGMLRQFIQTLPSPSP